MDPSSAHHHHHHQEMANQTLESMLVCTKTQQQEKKPRPQPEQALKCPRCDSTNTKFCYYNNYSLTQPRYFCKSCRRYWTKGGTLRNVPVGGGCRKNKRSSSKRSQDQSLTANHSPLSGTLPSLAYDSSDLSLAFARLVHHKQPNGQLGFDDHDQISMLGNHNTTHCDVFGNYHSAQSSATSTPSFLDALRGGYVEAPNGGFHNLYYGMGNNGNYIGHLESGGVGVNEEMGISYEDHMSGPTTPAVTVTAVKQELGCNNGKEGENRVLWGFPWQLGGDGNMGDHHHLDAAGRESWNGIGSSWHGLLNSPLM